MTKQGYSQEHSSAPAKNKSARPIDLLCTKTWLTLTVDVTPDWMQWAIGVGQKSPVSSNSSQGSISDALFHLDWLAQARRRATVDAAAPWPWVGTAQGGFEFGTCVATGEAICPLSLAAESGRMDLLDSMLQTLDLPDAPLGWREHAGRLVVACLNRMAHLDETGEQHFKFACALLSHGAVLPLGLDSLKAPLIFEINSSFASALAELVVQESRKIPTQKTASDSKRQRMLSAPGAQNPLRVTRPIRTSALAALLLFRTQNNSVMGQRAFRQVVTQNAESILNFVEDSKGVEGGASQQVLRDTNSEPLDPFQSDWEVLQGKGVMHLCAVANDPQAMLLILDKLNPGDVDPERFAAKSKTTRASQWGDAKSIAMQLGHEACVLAMDSYSRRKEARMIADEFLKLDAKA